MKVSELKTEMDAGFTSMREQFADVSERLAQVGRQFKEVDRRFEQVDRRFEEVDQRFEKVDQRFERIEAQLDDLRRSIAEEGVTTRRHMDMVAEHMWTQHSAGLDAVAALVAANEARLQALEQERPTIIAALDNHERRLSAIERKPRK